MIKFNLKLLHEFLAKIIDLKGVEITICNGNFLKKIDIEYTLERSPHSKFIFDNCMFNEASLIWFKDEINKRRPKFIK